MTGSLQAPRRKRRSREGDTRPAPIAALVALGALTLIALVLRIIGIDQTLYGDEYFTHTIVVENGLRGVWSEVFNTSITPPFHYFLAWLSVQLGGDDTILVRLPSLVLGTATVPLGFLLGRRVGGTRAGLLAAGLLALGPFSIWYSVEGRAYATMIFLVGLSTLALLQALDGRTRAWWVVYALSACLVLWTHYTAIFVILAQALWALWTHREQSGNLLLATAAAAAGFLPWVPGFLEQRQNDVGIEIIGVFSRLSLSRVFEEPLRTVVGHPFLALRETPGRLGLLLALALACLVVAAVAGRVRRPAIRLSLSPTARSESTLMLVLALATPAGLLLYAAVGTSLYLPRNLAASLPALAVVAGLVLDWLTDAAPRRVGAVAMASLVALFAVVSVESVLDDDDRRPAYREAARYLDEVAAPGDPVVDAPLPAADDPRFLRTTLDLYLQGEHPLYPTGPREGAAWRGLRAGKSVYLVAPDELAPRQYLSSQLEDDGIAPRGLISRLERFGGPDGRAIRRDRRTFPGIFRISVFRFSGIVEGRLERRGEREIISWSLGRRVPVAPGVARGSLEAITPPSEPLAISGWALRAGSVDLVDWVLLFSGDRLLALSPGGIPRPDIAAKYGPDALLSGFLRAPASGPLDRSKIRAFAVVGRRSSELTVSDELKRFQQR